MWKEGGKGGGKSLSAAFSKSERKGGREKGPSFSFLGKKKKGTRIKIYERRGKKKKKREKMNPSSRRGKKRGSLILGKSPSNRFNWRNGGKGRKLLSNS